MNKIIAHFLLFIMTWWVFGVLTLRAASQLHPAWFHEFHTSDEAGPPHVDAFTTTACIVGWPLCLTATLGAVVVEVESQ